MQVNEGRFKATGIYADARGATFGEPRRASGWIRTHDLSKRAAADLRLRPRGHWDRHNGSYY